MPHKRFEITASRRLVAVLLVFVEALVGWPAVVLGRLAEESTVEPVGERIGTIEYPANVTPKTGTDEGLVDVRMEFTPNPTDVELTAARVFVEPLIPMGSQVMAGGKARP